MSAYHQGLRSRLSGAREETLSTVDGWQQRRRPVAFCIAVAKKFGDDRAGRLAAIIAYYAFFSLFPLLLVAVTVIAYVLSDSTAEELRGSAIEQIPVVGSQIGAQVDSLDGSVTALVVGLATALWAGLGCMQAAQEAANEVWGTPRLRRPSFVRKRLRSLATVTIVAGALIAGGVSSQLISFAPDIAGVGRLLAFLLSTALNTAAFLLAFQILGTDRHRWRDLLPGAVVAGVGYVALQLVGQWYVRRSISGAEDTYGTFAVVIGLLGWLFVLAQLVVLAMEVNSVLALRLWPRSLRRDKPTAADKEMVRIAARSAQLRTGTRIFVEFTEPDGHHHLEPADRGP